MYNLSPSMIDGSIISSVVPPVTSLIRTSIEKITEKSVMIVGPGVKNGLNILMDNPAQVGSDLIVNAVAAIHEHKAPLIIIDMGTATTISVVDKNQNYIGGMITVSYTHLSLKIPNQTVHIFLFRRPACTKTNCTVFFINPFLIRIAVILSQLF